MNITQMTPHKETLEELGRAVRLFPRDPDSDYALNMWTKFRMKDIREFYRVPKTVLARAIGTSYRQYIRFEDGSSKVPVQVAGSLALFYNLSLDFICGLNNTPKTLYDGEPLEVNGASLIKSRWTAVDGE